MGNIILFDSDVRSHLLPLTYLRPVGELRVGILSIREKWERWMGCKVSFITEDHLAERYHLEVGEENLVINATVLPSLPLCRLLRNMEFGDAYVHQDELIAAKLDRKQLRKLINDEEVDMLHPLPIEGFAFHKINGLNDLIRLNAEALESDFHLLTAGRKSQPLSATNCVIAAERIFVEEGAVVEGAFLNARNGPIYIGAQAEIMEGACLRGPVAVCAHASVRMGAQVYGSSTIGPWCKVGGEVDHSILQGYSNKAHHGFLGHSFVGEWCNIGAGTSVSNLRNDYQEIKLWDYASQRFEPSGSAFCGLFMGDHARLGINMMINSGTSIGLASTLYGPRYPRNFIPPFTEAGPAQIGTHDLEHAVRAMEQMMERRQQSLDIQDRLTIIRLFEETAPLRSWEKQPGQ